ncbi:phosphoglycerate kinase [Hydromonas duriensis]|uniref:Uncharacterized protein n=1 Tax=Hydromonas duriensis TaxID=1527608 RepID=A0A4R6Y5Q8_9BURK|nr:phosphoglycerate kinase [Hydromonas duriensis]TDR28933.1 hypothetical protein DFR44_1302 [Hydromonas duriensis]
MGLDMYAHSIKADLVTDLSEVDAKVFNGKGGTKDGAEPDEFFVWRKHPNLHGWMEQLYKEKGGQNPDFNLNSLHLNRKDMEALKVDIEMNRLPETEGFFFGESDGSEREDDLKFVNQALSLIEQGHRIYYYAWW